MQHKFLKFGRFFRWSLLALALVTLAALFVPVKSAQALCKYCPSDGIIIVQNILAKIQSNVQHMQGRLAMSGFIILQTEAHKNWLVTDFFENDVLPALQATTEQLSANGIHQALTIGTFFDAKYQLETQVELQKLQYEAHKDYQPSEDFCTFGTNVRSLAASEESADYVARALNTRQMSRHLGQQNTSAAKSLDDDKYARWQQFTKTYCNPKDNMVTDPDSSDSTGLQAACGAGADDPERYNIDIDFTRLVDEKRTLDIDFRTLPSDADDQPASADEVDILALGNNLYGHDVLTRQITGTAFDDVSAQNFYMALRSVAAKRNVAENSYNAIVAMKSSGASDYTDDENAPHTREFLGAIMAELGVPAEEVSQLIGERPSYYAQLEILAKRIYQSPNFFAGLYDKPANVERKAVALKAIDLMLDRAIYESQLRQEMLNSVLLSSKLRLGVIDGTIGGTQ